MNPQGEGWSGAVRMTAAVAMVLRAITTATMLAPARCERGEESSPPASLTAPAETPPAPADAGADAPVGPAAPARPSVIAMRVG